MKFLIDVCSSSRSLITSLRSGGHDVVSMRDIDPTAPDTAVLAHANRESRILVTEDNDFGALVFVRRLSHPCIVRLVGMSTAEKVAAMDELIERHRDAMLAGSFIVVTQGNIRIRPPHTEGR